MSDEVDVQPERMKCICLYRATKKVRFCVSVLYLFVQMSIPLLLKIKQAIMKKCLFS